MDGGKVGDVVAHARDDIALLAHHERQGAALALTHDDDALALAGLALGKAAILAVGLVVLRANVTAEVCAVQLQAVELALHGFAQLVKQHESGFVLNVQIAACLKRTNALRAIHEDDHGGQQIGEGQLARSEDRPAGDAELVIAVNALELAAGADAVGLGAAATRAHRLAVCLRPAHVTERAVSGILAQAENLSEAKGAGLCGEEKVLCRVIVSSAYALDIVTMVNSCQLQTYRL